MITVIDYGMGNIASVANMIRYVGGASSITSDPAEIAAARKLILPGVGSFDAGMTALRQSGLDEAIQTAVGNGGKLLGICLGMQLLLEGSEEGAIAGLGLIAGRSRRLTASGRLRVPHMGWNRVQPVRPSSLFESDADDQRFYFVHSYFAECDDAADACAVSDYGRTFVSAVERGNVMGVQFHPEKSHQYGMTLFRRYLAL